MQVEDFLALEENDLLYHLDKPDLRKKNNPFENIKKILNEGLVPGKEKGKKVLGEFESKEVCLVENRQKDGWWHAKARFNHLKQSGGILYLIDRKIEESDKFMGADEVEKKYHEWSRYGGECKFFGTIKPEFIKKIIVLTEDLRKLRPVKKQLKEMGIKVYAFNRKTIIGKG